MSALCGSRFGCATGLGPRAQTLKVLVPVYNLLKGVADRGDAGERVLAQEDRASRPTWIPIAMAAGCLWCSPVVPNTGAHVADGDARWPPTCCCDHGFEPQMSISLATERTLICVITISYDRDVPGEDERALACYRDLSRQLIDAGYPPYRLSIASTDLDATGEFGNVVRAIKRALDPNGILAPRRYAGAVPHEDTRPVVAQR